MRFEIRGGGLTLIVLGVAALSGAVFALGLVAGYEMAKESQPDVNQLSSTYPLPSPQPTNENAPPSPAIAPAPSVAAGGAASIGATPPMIALGTRTATPAAHPTIAIARAPAPQAMDTVGHASENGESEASPTAHPGKPYNIQIEAVMDKSGADAMVAQLKSLGFSASSYTIKMGSENWYRVRFGPYPTQDEARAAAEKYHREYKRPYSMKQ
jgi:septal ring-binding cell division protein DamX